MPLSRQLAMKAEGDVLTVAEFLEFADELRKLETRQDATIKGTTRVRDSRLTAVELADPVQPKG